MLEWVWREACLVLLVTVLQCACDVFLQHIGRYGLQV